MPYMPLTHSESILSIFKFTNSLNIQNPEEVLQSNWLNLVKIRKGGIKLV